MPPKIWKIAVSFQINFTSSDHLHKIYSMRSIGLQLIASIQQHGSTTPYVSTPDLSTPPIQLQDFSTPRPYNSKTLQLLDFTTPRLYNPIHFNSKTLQNHKRASAMESKMTLVNIDPHVILHQKHMSHVRSILLKVKRPPSTLCRGAHF